MPVIQLKGRILYNGELFNPDEVLEHVDEEACERLVKADVASFVSGKSETVATVKADEEETQAETLELNFDLKELKEGAAEAGLDFPKSIKKADLIDMIIAAGHENIFLDQLED